jgi:DNA-directed RNA polymerase specialized sigma24 family protein
MPAIASGTAGGKSMDVEDEGSVTRWIGGLKAGNAGAADRLWHRYFDGLVRLARKKLDAVRRTGAAEDEEDAALSAFESLCAGAAGGRFERLKDRDDLWRLLVVITVRKVYDQVKRERQLKRGAGRVVSEAALIGSDPSGPGGFAQCIDQEPTPEFAAMLAEEFQRRIDGLEDETLRRVALWRMEGYSDNEIADRLGCVSRSVQRELELIRKAWLRDEP